jgi:secreted Zn-dependent insulinase-like peptidase
VTPRRGDGEAPINERILGLVATLSERVKHLESKLDGFEARKRPVLEELAQYLPARPFKQARMSQSDVVGVQNLQNYEIAPAENDSSTGQNSSDAEAEDAATVLEFLAWGRLKDSNLTTGVRDPGSLHDSAACPEKDVIQNAQAWSNSPPSQTTGQTIMETLQVSQIQEMLPSKMQVSMLFEYHSDWLLFMHCSFHVQTFSRELDMFYEQDNGIINMTSVGLQWISLLFAIMCGSMTCTKPAQVAKWGFHQGKQILNPSFDM